MYSIRSHDDGNAHFNFARIIPAPGLVRIIADSTPMSCTDIDDYLAAISFNYCEWRYSIPL